MKQIEESAPTPPRVSVVVPAYNAELTLALAVESALAGTFRDIEVIIVDDGSTDETSHIARQLAGTDRRVKLVQRQNGGVSAAFNSGLAVASGEWVARLDSDDLWHPAKLERQVKVAERDPGAAFIYTLVRYIDSRGSVVRDGPNQSFPRKALCRGIYESLVGANSSAMMLRSAAIEAGGYDEALLSWEDLLLQLRINARSPITFVPEYLVGYRLRSSSLSANVDDMLDSWRVARTLIRREFKQVPEIVHAWAHGRRCADFAEAFAWRGNLVMCLRLLVEAGIADWTWTSRLVVSRAMRRIRRGLARRQHGCAGPRFQDCDPGSPVSPVARPVSALSALEAKRVARLSAMDAALSAATPATAP